MKHNLQITIILLAMFLITQLIGLAVINAYSPKQITIINETTGQLENVTITPELPYGMQPPKDIEPGVSLISILIAMTLAVALIFLLSRINAAVFLRIWFFVVVVIALGITINSLFISLNLKYLMWIAILIALPLAIYKIFKRNLIVHNITELMIYPGIAAVFVPILNIWTVVVLLLAISVYDIWAVWHTGFMQKMAKFQIKELKLFAGFFVPYISKKQRAEIAKLKKVEKAEKQKEKKIKISLAILGGGDVVFPIITAGVILRVFGFLPALMITIFATIALAYLFFFAKKGKFYPAMPFITAGCLVGLLVAFLI